MTASASNQVRPLVLAILLCGLFAQPVRAQWYFTYDQAIQSYSSGNWPVARQKFEQAKEEASRAKKQPGRSVLRTSGDYRPFIPDYYLVYVYSKLAASAVDDTQKKAFSDKAAEAFEAAKKNQVRDQDPEFTRMSAALASLAPAPGPGPGPAPPGPGPVVPPNVVAQQELRKRLDQGERALAEQDWSAAVTAFSDVQRGLDGTPALKSEFPTIGARVAEASLGRDIAAALRQLRDARDGQFGAVAETLERLNQTAAAASLSSAQTRSLRDAIPKRIAEARLADSLVTAEAAMRNRQWSAARDAYDAARRQAEGMEFTSSRAKELSSQAGSRLQQASLNAALAERRFVDALAIDGKNKDALDGQYRLATTEYNEGRWQGALSAFDTLLKYAPAYSQGAVDYKAAAEMQVELGLAVQAADPVEARRHYDRIQALQKTIRGSVRDTEFVVKASAEASARLLRIDADSGMASARKRYQDAQWDEARSSVNLVLKIFPTDPDALALLAKLNDNAREAEIADLKNKAIAAFDRGDLDGAALAAKNLDAKLPGSSDAASILAKVSSTQASIQATRRLLYQRVTLGLVIASIGPILLVSPRRRGRFLAAVGRPVSALHLYDRVLSADPGDGDTLARAADLATRYGVHAPLDRHFEAYVRSRPGDVSVARLAADFFWTKGAKQRAAELYEQLLDGTTNQLPPVAYERMSELYQASGYSANLAVFERARRQDPGNPGLIKLLARRYIESNRSDADALDVYHTACDIQPDDAALRMIYARALLANGDVAAACRAAERAAAQQPDSEAALDLLTDVCAQTGEAGVVAALSRLEQLPLPPISLLVVAEGLATSLPAIRAFLGPMYERQMSSTDDRAVAGLFRTHRCLDRGDFDAAATCLEGAQEATRTSRLASRALIRGYQRYFAACTEGGRVIAPALIARVAQLQADGGWWQDAVASWQHIVSIPEWNRNAMTGIQNILDSRSLLNVVESFFRTAGWQVGPGRHGEGGFTECLVTAGASVSAGLAALFRNTQVFSFDSVVSVDDVVGLKRQVLASRREEEKAVAFVVATHAIRHDVYSLIYAFMTEEPAVTLIPIEAQSMKEAIVEARTQVYLERTLHQWLGHTDIYETHNPVSNAATFFGRGQSINQLVLKISRGENFGIFGLRKIGKTSLVYRLRELSRDHLVAYVDLQGVASRRSDDVYVQLLESLVRDMRTKHPDVALPALKLTAEAGRGGTDVPGAFHADMLSIRTAFETSGRALPHMLLLLDEIELMIPYGGSPGFEGHQGFFRHIRGLYQQERFIVSAVVGATPTVCRTAKWDGRDNPVFQFYDEVFLAPLDQPECDQMVQGLGELMGVRYDPPSLRLIYEQTAGHPYIARQLCSRLVKSFPERPLEVRREMVMTAVDEYLAQRGDYFAGLLEGYLDDAARRIVETVAKAGDTGERRSAILAQTDSLGIGRHLADQALGDLELVGLVSRSGEQYSLAIPLFRRWLRRSWLDVE